MTPFQDAIGKSPVDKTVDELAANAPLERRREMRSTMSLMRAAKLICQSGEYVCLLRDVSEGGVRLRMFHPVPDEVHIFLELANGDVHPLIRVWESGNTAGFRFVQPVDPQHFLAPANAGVQREISLRISAPALLSTDGQTFQGVLRGLSAGSIRVESNAYFALCQSLMISIEGVGECAGWVRSRRGRAYEITLETIARLDQLAAQALSLQPLSALDSNETRLDVA